MGHLFTGNNDSEEYLLNKKPDTNIIMYTTEDGMIKIEATFDNDTVWLSIDQMAELFQRDKSTISRHIKNIFTEGELNQNSVVANFATTGRISHKQAISKAHSEYEKFKRLQDNDLSPVEQHFLENLDILENIEVRLKD